MEIVLRLLQSHHLTLLQFVEELPNAQLQWIEECGHVPHLEKPEETADAIALFLENAAVGASARKSTRNRMGDDAKDDEKSSVPTYLIGGGFVGALLLEEIVKQFF